MKKDWSLNKENFDLLLEWLSSDREKAGEIYEKIRRGLIKLFLIRGCINPEVMADEAINRVSSKIPGLINEYQGNPAHYFYNVAGKVYLESLSVNQKKEEQLDSTSHFKQLVTLPEKKDTGLLECLMECLGELSKGDRELIIQYFAVDKSAKFEHRRKMAEERNINLNVLRIKVARLKKKLHECILRKSV